MRWPQACTAKSGSTSTGFVENGVLKGEGVWRGVGGRSVSDGGAAFDTVGGVQPGEVIPEDLLKRLLTSSTVGRRVCLLQLGLQ